MIGKIKLTQEQADAVKAILGECNEDVSQAIDDHADVYNNQNDRWVTVEFQPLNGLSVSDFARALLIGYEVEPEFKIGDWVFNVKSKRIAQIDQRGVTSEEVWVEDDMFNFFGIEDARHATPEEIVEEKERRKWAEIKEGDVLRKIPMAHDIGIYEGEGDDLSILVRNESGQHLWKKCQVELYAKKVGATNEKDN